MAKLPSCVHTKGAGVVVAATVVVVKVGVVVVALGVVDPVGLKLHSPELLDYHLV